MDPIVIAYGVGVLAVALLTSVPLYRAYQMHRAGQEPLRDDVCVACQSAEITPLAPGVYRCRKCGFEGGSGMAEYQRTLAVARIEQMDEKSRYESAIRDLQESRLALLGARGLLENAGVMSAVDMADLDLDLDRGSTKQSVVVAATKEMRRAGNCIAQASIKLRQNVAGGVNADVSSLALLLDSSLFGDSLVADAAAHAGIDSLRQETERALSCVEQTLRQLQSS